MWDLLVIQPMVNALLFLYLLLFNNLTLTIAIFTILIRALTFPLTWQQQKQSKAMLEMQNGAEYKKIQEKYKGDREKLAQEQMRLMQEMGVNPLGGCLPMVIQLPLLFGMYQAIVNSIAASPIQLLTLSTHIYPFLPNINSLIPLDNHFLWLNLGLPDPYYILPLLVVATSWIQSKVMTPPPSTDPNAAQTAQTMAITSTVMFGYFSLTFASGLSIYFIIANIIGIIQYSLTQKINWRNVFSFSMAPAIVPAGNGSGGGGESKRKKK